MDPKNQYVLQFNLKFKTIILYFIVFKPKSCNQQTFIKLLKLNMDPIEKINYAFSEPTF